MPSRETLDQFTDILRDLLADNDIVLHADTRRETVPKWDSMNYLNFIMALEMRYGVKFPLSQVESFETVGEIADAVEKRLRK